MSSMSGRVVGALRMLGLALIGLFLAAPLFSEELAWGLWPATYLPIAWRWGLALSAAILACAGDRLAGAVKAAVFDRAPGPRPAATALPAQPVCLWSALPLRAAIALAAAVPFYLFRIVHTRWGDAYILVNSIPHPQIRLTYTWQAPLDVFLHAKAWAAGHALFGWTDAMPAYWIISAAAGVAFVWVLLALADWLGRNNAERWLIVGLAGTLGTMQLFFGYIENYTLMTLGMLIYIALALRALRGEISMAWPALALAITHALHPSTLVLAPSLLYVAWAKSAKRRAWNYAGPRGVVWIRKVAANLLPVAVPYAVVGAAVVALMTLGGHGLSALFGSDAPGGSDRSWFVPLWHAGSRWEHYTMFSLGHLRDIINEQLLAAPAVLPALLLVTVLAWPRVRKAWAGRAMDTDLPGAPGTGSETAAQMMRFLVLMACSYLLLIWVWNADYGGQRDWDLFSPAAVPAALLLAYVLPRCLPEEALRAAAWALVVPQVLHTAAWIFQNTRPWSWS